MKFWASVPSAVVCRHAAAEISARLAPVSLCTQLNAVAFTVEAARLDAALAAALGSLTLVEYIYVSLAACSAPDAALVIGMADICAAVEAVPWAVLDSAVSFWSVFARRPLASAVEAARAPAAASAPFTFRVVSKRGGGTHTFSSRDLKREVANVLAAAHPDKMVGCFKDHAFDLTARVHGSDFFLGLLLNFGAPLFSSLQHSSLPVDTPMLRYRLRLAYNGSGFHGWQKQLPRNGTSHRTVEGELELKLRPLLRQPLRFIAGHTDAGASAKGQVVHFDASSSGDSQQLTLHPPGCDQQSAAVPVTLLAAALNEVLPADLRVLEATTAPTGFCAKDALWKRYTYQLPTGAALTQFCSDKLLETRLEADLPCPDVGIMNDAASFLIGTHDFAGFQSKGGQKTTVRTIFTCAFTGSGGGSDGEQGEAPLVLTIEADSFLMHMVRIIVGTLLQAGCGLRPPNVTQQVLFSLCRCDAGPTVPADGLCLEHVEYENPVSLQAYRQGSNDAAARLTMVTGCADKPPPIAILWAHLNGVGRRFGVGMEGNLAQKTFARKRRNLSKLAAKASSILEVGFNAGHSCALFWVANPRVHVLSFDLNSHPYVEPCHRMLVEAGLRGELVLGDSRLTVPDRARDTGADTKFDLIHIDGGHLGDVPASDLLNCRSFAHRDTLVVFDDTGPVWTTPAIEAALAEALATQLIKEVDYDSMELEKESDHRVFRYCLQAPELNPYATATET